MKNGFDSINFNKTPNKFISNESKIFNKDKSLNTFRGKTLNKYINRNNDSKISSESHLFNSNSSVFNINKLYSPNEKIFINFGKKKIYPSIINNHKYNNL